MCSSSSNDSPVPPPPLTPPPSPQHYCCHSPPPPPRNILSFQQVEQLSHVISKTIDVNPKEGNFPTLSITPVQLIKAVRRRLDEKGIDTEEVRLNGSAASYCIAKNREESPALQYNDLDIIFKIHIKSDLDLHIIKDEVLNSLFDFFPKETQTDRISCFMLEEFYIKKMVKVSTSTTSTDRWSLLSLGDVHGTNIELKFVDSMKRQYEFSIDSFQIILDPLLSFDDAQSGERSLVKLDADFYPRVQVVSLYGDYEKAIDHLNNRLISTKNPEGIRGGGLLKYCHLLVSGYSVADQEEMDRQEPYMCSRFFIDFPSGNAQYSKIYKYVFSRYLQSRQPRKGQEFLEVLLRVVGSQARCLMDSERFKTISILHQIRSIILWHFGEPPFCQLPPYYAPVHHHHRAPASPVIHSQWQPYSHQYQRYKRTGSDSSSPPMIQFPHSANNTLPIGPNPTPVR